MSSSSSSSTPSLTIHHLQVSQSERLPWLLAELSLPYNLVLHQRSPYFSPPSIHALNPLGQAPVLQDGSAITLFESAACVEYIVHKHGNGRLMLPPSHPDYAQFLYWWHFANGNLQPLIMSKFQLERLMGGSPAGIGSDKAGRPFATDGAEEEQRRADYAATVQARFEKTLGFMDERLRQNEWLAGKEFTVADIMSLWSLTTVRVFIGFELYGYEGLLGWMKRCTEREGYKNARSKADPGLESCAEAEKPRGYAEILKERGEREKKEGKGGE